MQEMTIEQARDSYSAFEGREFRTYQRETIEAINSSTKRVVVVKAPTGSGKSIIGMVTGDLESKFAYLCSSKSLQDQINKDFGKEVKLLKGRSNYPCSYISRNNASQCINSPSTPCPIQHKCAYKLQKRAADQSRRQVLNYPYVMTEFNYVGSMNGGEPYPLMIADEADVLESIISSFVSLTISNQAISKYGLQRPPFKTFSEVNVSDWLTWSRGLERKLKPKLDYLGESISEATGMQPYELLALQREQQDLTSLLAKVGIFANNVDKTWVANISERQTEFKPLWLRESLAEQYYWRHAHKHVLLSATWPEPDIIARTLGLPIGDIDMIDVPSTFPVGANPVYLCNVGDMSRKTIAAATPKILDAIKTLLNHHANHKGVIHTGNYEVCRAIMATGNPRLITHDQFNKQAQIDKFTQSDQPLVFVSPSSTRGLDLPGDLCRFTITAKAPYQSLGDSFVAGRTYSKPLGQRWFTSCCAQEIEQGVGRGMRSQDDWCENYILDIAACKLIAGQRSMFGEYFNQSVKFKTI